MVEIMDNSYTRDKARSRGIFLKTVFVFLLLLTIIAASFSINGNALNIPSLIEKGSGYTSVLYDNSNGLPTSEANCIVQTGDGFIWIGSYSGLIRYNGNEFYRYPSSSGISSVVCLYVDSRDRLWIGTNDNGLAVMDTDNMEFKFYKRSDGLSSSSVRAISEDSNGNIIFGTTMGIAYIDKDLKLHNIDEPQINKEYICDLCADQNGTLFGVTLSGIIFTLKDKRISSLCSAKNFGFDGINSVYPDPGNPGFAYFGADGKDSILYGDVLNNMAGVRIISVAPHNTVNTMDIFNGNLWCGTDAGIGYFEKDQYIPLDDIPMTNSVDDMMSDHEGNLWFCSSRQGLMKIVENRFIDISGFVELPPMVVNSTCKYNGDLYLGTDSGLKILDKDYNIKKNAMTKLLDGVRIRCIRADSKNNIWFCTYGDTALIRYDPATGKYKTFNEESGLASNRVRMITEMSDGKMAVATNGGVNIISDDKIEKKYGNDHGITNLEILCMEEGYDGRLYLGSDGDGIYIVNNNNVSRLGLDDGLQSEVILRIKKDPKDNTYWIITSNSISYMQDEKITTIKNFPYSNNFDVFFDSNDQLWILSSNGIYVVSRDEMKADGDHMDYTLYDTKCGLPTVATANSYSHIDNDGTLYISGSTGISSVNINNENSFSNDVRLSISFINVDEKEIYTDDLKEIHIPYDCRRLTIYANAFTYSLNNPTLSYCLEGFDNEPVEIKKQSFDEISYTNLSGGTYNFKLSLLNSITGKTERTVTIKIIKDHAFYETTWFRVAVVLLAALLTAGIVFIYYRRKTTKLLRRQEYDKRLINEMTFAFAKCVDVKDAYTNGHSFRVAKYTAMFAKRLGKSQDEVDKIYNIALLHDIGKISIPLKILNKPGRLTDEEFEVMKTHSVKGYEILQNITIEPDLALGAEYHHERIDGKGYPSGLKGENIPEVARMIAVADTFDAMYSTRPYRKKLPIEKIIAEIKRCSGTQLDPKVVKVFLELAEEGAFDADREPDEPEEKKFDGENKPGDESKAEPEAKSGDEKGSDDSSKREE